MAPPPPGPSGADTRKSFQHIMELAELPSTTPGTRRFMQVRRGWLPGSDIPDIDRFGGLDGGGTKPLPRVPHGSFGGQVYSQAALAACRTVDDEEKANGISEGDDRLGIHTIHGYFCLLGFIDRPFIYTVTPVSSQRSFVTRMVVVRQTYEASDPSLDHFPPSDADHELGPVCFSAIISFKLPDPHSCGVNTQEPSAQTRFASILSQRRPEEWTPSPPLDIDGILDVTGREIVGEFPAVEMKKVDMRSYNEGRPMHEKRELLLYRLLTPLPAKTAEEKNAHALVHAYEADRNGLLMAANFLGFGRGIWRVASLSYSFVIHTNIEECIMRHESEEGGNGGWWIQEMSFPRAGNGRAMLESKIWSPEGVHVATEYQDGLTSGREKLFGKGPPGKGKL